MEQPASCRAHTRTELKKTVPLWRTSSGFWKKESWGWCQIFDTSTWFHVFMKNLSVLYSSSIDWLNFIQPWPNSLSGSSWSSCAERSTHNRNSVTLKHRISILVRFCNPFCSYSSNTNRNSSSFVVSFSKCRRWHSRVDSQLLPPSFSADWVGDNRIVASGLHKAFVERRLNCLRKMVKEFELKMWVSFVEWRTHGCAADDRNAASAISERVSALFAKGAEGDYLWTAQWRTIGETKQR